MEYISKRKKTSLLIYHKVKKNAQNNAKRKMCYLFPQKKKNKTS